MLPHALIWFGFYGLKFSGLKLSVKTKIILIYLFDLVN
jgi:hypothetical protein